MALSPARVEHLVAALLTVNGFPVDRAVGLMPAFRKAGLLEAGTVSAMDGDRLVAAFNAVGYARGGYLQIIGYRLVQALVAAESGRLDQLTVLADDGDEDGFRAALGAVHGFGPSTSATAWFLWTARARGEDGQ